MCLYLLEYFIYLLQPLDIDKTLLTKKTQFIIYNISKANFISLIQKTW